jgi:Carboxypeptidase regulatory-like domain
MRKWVGFVALVAVAACAGVWLLQRERQADAALPGAREAASVPAGTPTANLAEPATPIAVVAAAPEDQREVVAPAPTDSSAADASQATLSVVARSKESSAPLAGVRILVWPIPAEAGFGIAGGSTSSASFGTSPVTDNSGHAQITVPSRRTFSLVAQQDDDLSAPVKQMIEPLAPGETREIEVLLATEADLHFVGRVVEDSTGAALAQAWVTCGDGEDLVALSFDPIHPLAELARPGTDLHRFEVDGEGCFELDARSWKDQVVRVDAEDHAWALVELAAGHATRSNAFEVRLARTAQLEVLALGPGRIPLAGARLRLSTESYEVSQTLSSFGLFMPEPVRWSLESAADGRARFDAVPPRVTLRLEAAAPDSTTYRVVSEPPPLEPGEVRTLEIAIGAGARILGTMLLANGQPVSGAEIWMRPWQGPFSAYFSTYQENEVRVSRTNSEGSFVFEDVPDGEWVIAPKPEGAHAAVPERVTIADGHADRDVVMTVFEDLFIRGTVLDPNGEPAAAFVAAFGRLLKNAQADKEGRYSLGPLAPGKYTVQAMGAGAAYSRSQPVEAQAGASDVNLTLSFGGCMAGSVVDASTGEVTKARVTVAPQRDSPEVGLGGAGAIGSSDSEGKFAFDGLDPGVYSVSASTSGGGCAVAKDLRLDSGTRIEGLVLRVRPGGRVRVRYEGPESVAQIRVYDGVAVVALDGVRRGTDSTWVVTTGKLVVQCTEGFGADLRRQEQEVTVEAGKLAEVVFPAQGSR